MAIVNLDGGFRGFVRSQPGEFELIEYPSLSVPCNGVRSINQRGEMVGGFAYVSSVDECLPNAAGGHGYLLRDGQFTLIDFPGAVNTDAMSINDDRVIVGRFTDRHGRTVGFEAKPRGVIPRGRPSSGSENWLWGRFSEPMIAVR